MKILIDVDDQYRPEDGDAFDAVVSALDFAKIPARVVEATGGSSTTEPGGSSDVNAGPSSAQQDGASENPWRKDHPDYPRSDWQYEVANGSPPA